MRRGTAVLVAAGLTFLRIPAATGAETPAAEASPPAGPTAPRTAEDFFWTVDAFKAGSTADVVRAALGEPTKVTSTNPRAGETRQTWLYKVTPLTTGAGAPAPEETRDVKVVLYQPLGGDLGYERAEVFLPATDAGGGQALTDAVREWKNVSTLRTLVAVAKLLPLGTPTSDIKELLGLPVDGFISDVNTKDSDRRMTYFRQPKLKVEFNLARSKGGTGGSRYVYTGATLYSEGK